MHLEGRDLGLRYADLRHGGPEAACHELVEMRLGLPDVDHDPIAPRGPGDVTDDAVGTLARRLVESHLLHACVVFVRADTPEFDDQPDRHVRPPITHVARPAILLPGSPLAYSRRQPPAGEEGYGGDRTHRPRRHGFQPRPQHGRARTR